MDALPNRATQERIAHLLRGGTIDAEASMTKIDEGFDRATSTRWGKRILLVIGLLGVAFVLFRVCG